MQSEWKVMRFKAGAGAEVETELRPCGKEVRRERIQRDSLARRVAAEKARSMAKKEKFAGPQTERK